MQRVRSTAFQIGKDGAPHRDKSMSIAQERRQQLSMPAHDQSETAVAEEL